MQESLVFYQLVLEEADFTKLVRTSFGERPLGNSLRQHFAAPKLVRAGAVAALLGCQSVQGLPF